MTEDGDRAHVLEIADPTPGAGQVRVRLAAAGVNPVDGKSAFARTVLCTTRSSRGQTGPGR